MSIVPGTLVRLAKKVFIRSPELRGSHDKVFTVFSFCSHTFSARSVEIVPREIIVHGLRSSDFTPLE